MEKDRKGEECDEKKELTSSDRDDLRADSSFNPMSLVTDDKFCDARRIIELLRGRVSDSLDPSIDQAIAQVYLLSYDLDVAKIIFGDKSAIYVGIEKGLVDAIHLINGDVSVETISRMSELGRWHGIMVLDFFDN